MRRIGITGQRGFLGWALTSTVSLLPKEFELVPFDRTLFERPEAFAAWVARCDVVVHLAAVNRHPDSEVVYETNIRLCQALADAVRRANTRPQVVFSSSTQESLSNRYGQAKKEGREILKYAMSSQGAPFMGLIIPHIFGPFGRSNYNSVVATFCDRLCHGIEPVIDEDSSLKLIYVGEVVSAILSAIRGSRDEPLVYLEESTEMSVSALLAQLHGFRDQYLTEGFFPALPTAFEVNLFNTFRSYVDYSVHFPRALTAHRDMRGSFIELVRCGSGGQFAVSSTAPGVTRGNHLHTRKVERFTVIRGRGLVQFRRYGASEVLEFELDGEHPAYVDIPIWHAHNIRNIGTTELITTFWVNELFDPSNSDTFAETV